MQSRLLYIVALLVVPAAVLSQSVEETFERGNALFREGKFAESATAYDSILAQGMASAEFYFNLGNAGLSEVPLQLPWTISFVRL